MNKLKQLIGVAKYALLATVASTIACDNGSGGGGSGPTGPNNDPCNKSTAQWVSEFNAQMSQSSRSKGAQYREQARNTIGESTWNRYVADCATNWESTGCNTGKALVINAATSDVRATVTGNCNPAIFYSVDTQSANFAPDLTMTSWDNAYREY